MEHTSSVDVVYVTAIYKIQSYHILETMIQDFKPFLSTKLKIIVYTNIESLVLENMECIYLPTKELKAFQRTDLILPDYRNQEKDTLDFLQLTNSKPEFLFRASKYIQANTYVWFDFGILKIIKNVPDFFIALENVKEISVPDKIVIPGCTPLKQTNIDNIHMCPLWRFCGGIIIAAETKVELFYNLHMKELECCFEIHRITWEQNIWAVIEQDEPDLLVWYYGDTNDTILQRKSAIQSSISIMPPINYTPSANSIVKIILLTMIKNESAIIRRCLETASFTCDALCVCDTGSTDNTVDIVTTYFKNSKIPGRLYTHPWKNFGYNRSQSFLAAVDLCKELGWNPDTTYAVLLDADMNFHIGPKFNKDSLSSPGYCILQKSPGIEYYNTRFVKIGFPWKCVGVTHEYWDGYNSDTLSDEFAYINDIGDGGCKSDKFQRDIQLLNDGLIEEPKNERYMFYLAQSYKDTGHIEKAIEYYVKRIDAGGWVEEIWYSMYTLMKLYADKGDKAMMEMWGQKAYEYHNRRTENILFLVKYFRENGQFYKAWHYWNIGYGKPKPDDILFIEPDVYTYSFEKERLILFNTIFPHKKSESLNYAIEYFNSYRDDWAYFMIKWFVQKIPIKVRELKFQPIGDFIPTSTSFCKYGNMYIVNVRYVNYRIQPNGSYLMCENGIINNANWVRTENYYCTMDLNFNIISPLQKMEILDKPLHNTNIKGLEDVRIFTEGKTLRYIATTLEYSYNGRIRQHIGTYNIQTNRFENNMSVRPPIESECEKNWIPYKENKIIYKWHPLQIGSIRSDNLVIDTSQPTPLFFNHIRGSTTFIEEGGFLWGITHCVIYEQPRKYYHCIIKINPENDMIVSYTQPFFFMNNAIEYCLSVEKRGDIFYSIVSQNDSNPIFVEWSVSDVVWKNN